MRFVQILLTLTLSSPWLYSSVFFVFFLKLKFILKTYCCEWWIEYVFFFWEKTSIENDNIFQMSWLQNCECETKRVWVCHIVSIFNGSSNGKKKNYIYDKLCLADAACAVFTQQMVEFNATTPFVLASLSWCEPDISYPLLPFSLSHVIIVFSFESCLHTNNNKKKETNFNEKKITISSR